ncbi:MAG: hypothetical protein J6Y10_10355 [Lachnospiraceae bacterium]|nr:hypothetical protein [Lachnospiraceae bacterium]
MAAIKEKHGTHCEVNTMSYEENKPKAFERLNLDESSYRVYEDGKVGIFHCIGTVSDEEGYAKAQADPERARPYPFSPEAGSTRVRDLSETEFSAGELMALAEEYMKYLTDNYPQFTFSGKFTTTRQTDTFTNDLGADYSNSDASVGVGIMFKHKDSKNIMDGDFEFNMRTPDDGTKFREMADLYLGKWDTAAEIPEDVILDMQYYGFADSLVSELDAEEMSLGNSRLSGKLGEKVFADSFTLEHDATDKESWYTRFWDGEGCVIPGDKLLLIENGVIKIGYSDKRVADKYGVPHTKTAGRNFGDLTYPGGMNVRIRRSDKTIRELLDGRCAVIPIDYTRSQLDQKGDMTIVINSSLLWDGDKVIGRLPEFKVKTNFYDIFGKDFLGVGSDNPATYHDKQMLLRVERV